MNKTVKVFYCYASADRAWLDQLDKQLAPLKRLNEITAWSDCDIQAGKNWTQEIQSHLNEAGIILVLVSPDFIASNYCYDNQMQTALDRQKSGTAYVIPIILRPVMWEHTPLGKLQALPPTKKAVTLWPDHDEALYEVAKGIRDVVKLLIPSQALSPNATKILDQMGNPVLGFACPTCHYINRLGAKFCARDGVGLSAGAGGPPPRSGNQPGSPPNPQQSQTPVQSPMPGRVELRYEPGKDLIPLSKKSEIIPILVEIDIINVLKTLFVSNRSPLSLSIVIDHSNFMKGIKLESGKKAAEMVIDELEPTDYVSVVIFDDTSQVIIPSMPCNDKPGMKAAIDQIRDAGGTTMSLGMIQGLNELCRWDIPNAVRCMILLTNGTTTQEDAERCCDLARDAAKEDIRIHPFGMSYSWDIPLLTTISQLSGGNTPVLLLPNTNVLHTVEPGRSALPIMTIHNALLTINLSTKVSLRRAVQVTPTFVELDRSQLGYSQIGFTLGKLEESTLYEYLLELAVTPQSSGTFRLAQAELSYDMPLIGRVGEKEFCDIVIHFVANQGQSAQINSPVMRNIFPYLSKLSKLRYFLSKLP